MKKTIYSFMIAMLLVSIGPIASAQDANRVPTEKTRRFLLRYISYMDTTTSIASKEALLKGIEMVATSSKADWISQYHASFQNAIIGASKPDSAAANKMLNKAEEFINIAKSLEPKESEIVLLASMINGMRIGVNPDLGATLGPDVMKGYAEAKKLNPENPRVYLVLGESYMYMPEAAGGGMKIAKANLEIALKKFEKDTHEDPAWPNWGKDRAMKLLEDIAKKK